MIIILTIFIVTISTFSIFLAINPLSIGLLILYIALFLALSFAYSISSWIAFLIFLIYIGGILVIFSYFVSIIPNQTIPFLYTFITISTTIIVLITLSSYLKISPPTYSSFSSHITILYLPLNTRILFLLAIILLFTMVVVVKLTTSSKGPLRPFY